MEREMTGFFEPLSGGSSFRLVTRKAIIGDKKGYNVEISLSEQRVQMTQLPS